METDQGRERQLIQAPLGRAERIAMESRRAAAIEAGFRAHRWFLFRGALIYLFWLLAGLFLMGLSFHLTNQKYADLAFQLSFLVGYGGMFFSAVGIYVRGRERGEFE
jgi:hypothetical protein